MIYSVRLICFFFIFAYDLSHSLEGDLKTSRAPTQVHTTALTDVAAEKYESVGGHNEIIKLPNGLPGIPDGSLGKAVNELESKAIKAIQKDRELDGITPAFYREVELERESESEPGKKIKKSYMAMQDLLTFFQKEKTHILDIKISWRTFLEDIGTGDFKSRQDTFTKLALDSKDDLKKIFQAADMLDKLHSEQFSKKDRLNLRDHLTSSRTLGFRVCATKNPGEEALTKKDHARLKDEEEVYRKLDAFLHHCIGEHSVKDKLIERLEYMLQKIEKSTFFKTHEVIASSILIVFDGAHLGAWLIDFGKTAKLKQGVKIDHVKIWVPGNYEDGFIAGLKNLIKLLKYGYVLNEPPKHENQKGTENAVKNLKFDFCTIIKKLHLFRKQSN